MFRIFFTYVLPLLLPTAIYMIWVWRARRNHDHDSDDAIPELQKGPLFWSMVLGFLLMAVGLATLALTSGDPPDSGVYQSPRLQDGKVVPPSYKQDKP
ncbi:MAG: DUF6111 family protein [Proteobacteria bacterium]|nr:DUF6111 family protein [Pseudomonadota bacterium]